MFVEKFRDQKFGTPKVYKKNIAAKDFTSSTKFRKIKFASSSLHRDVRGKVSCSEIWNTKSLLKNIVVKKFTSSKI
jgi:hypothetical protein